MSASPTNSATQPNTIAMSILAGVVIVAVVLWTSVDRLAGWARTHRFTTDQPLFTVANGAGPTWQFTALITLTLAALAIAVVTTLTYLATKPRIPIAATINATLSTATAAIAWTAALVFPTHQTLALIAAIGTAAAIAVTARQPLARSLARADVLAVLKDRTTPHLGYASDDDTHRAVRVDKWDARDPARPHHITIRPAKRYRVSDRTVDELTDVVNQCAIAHANTPATYTLDHDLLAGTITAATIESTHEITEPDAIRKLRQIVTKPQFFKDGATVSNIRLHRRTGAITAFDIHHQISHELVDSARPRAIERRLGMMISDGRWRATKWNWPEGTVHFSLRRELPKMILPAPIVPIQPLNDSDDALAAARRKVIDTYPDIEFIYGIDEDGNKLGWRPRILAHTLTIGATGSGKTSLTQTIIAAATAAGWPVIIIDFKGIEYTQFRDWPNVTMIIDTIEAAVAVIHQFAVAMQRRYIAVKHDPAKLNDMMPFMLVIDEYAEFMDRLRAFYAETKPEKKAPRECPTLKEVDSILRLARSSRMHGYVGLQRPDAKIMESSAGRDQLTHRVSVGPLTSQGAMMMWGSAFIGRTVPVGVRGRATAKNNRGEPVEIQCYYTPNPDLDAKNPQLVDFFEQQRPPRALWERQVVEHPDPDRIDEGADFFYYQSLQIFNASDRPDLDPLSEHYTLPHSEADIDDYDVSSGMLGVTGRPTAATTPDGIRIDAEVADKDEFTWEDAYDEPTDQCVADLAHGDLIRIDLDSDQWVLLDGEPEQVDDHHMALYWRDVMSGEEGDTLVAIDSTVQLRPERELAAA